MKTNAKVAPIQQAHNHQAQKQADNSAILQAYKKSSIQLKTPEEEEKPVQGKFETAQLAELGEEKEEEPSQLKANNTGLPDQLKAGVENLSGYSLDDVNVHYNSSQPATLQAHAYAQGTDIHVAPGQEKHLAHEAWHVVQQKQGRVKPTTQLKGTVPVNNDKGLEKEADVMGAKALILNKPSSTQLRTAKSDSETKQMVFIGPQFNPGGNHNGNYPGHQFNTGGAMANTGCGVSNSIRTAGEHLAPGAASKPGTPTGMNLYRGGFSRGGGLVRDKNLNQASTKMHLINHRLENSGNTQRTPANIFLGTQKSNNPTHLNQVETPVINAVTNHATRNNNRYEQAMANAQQLNHSNGQPVLYWPNNALPHVNAIAPNDLNDAILQNGIVSDNVGAGGNARKKTKLVPTGQYLDTANYNPGLKHLWLNYQVTPNYNAVPAHVTNNTQVETIFANTKKQKQRTMLLNKIAAFTNQFAPNAFPSTFTNQVTYYYASYNPNNIYSTEQENHTINADL